MSDGWIDTSLAGDDLGEDEELTFDFEHPLTMRTVGAGTVEVEGRALVVARDVELTVLVDLPTWERVYDAGCFHLDDEPEPAGFEAGRPVELQLRLRRRVVAAFDDPESLLRSLLTDDGSPTRHTESWYALQVTQRLEVPGDPDAWVEIGVTTRYAEGQ